MTDEELKAEQTNEAQVTIAPTTGEPQEKKAPPPFTRTQTTTRLLKSTAWTAKLHC